MQAKQSYKNVKVSSEFDFQLRECLILKDIPYPIKETSIKLKIKKNIGVNQLICQVYIPKKEKGYFNNEGFAYVYLPDDTLRKKLFELRTIKMRKRSVKIRPAIPLAQFLNNFENEKSRRVHIKHLKKSTTEKDLKAYFSKFGKISDVFLIKDFSNDSAFEYAYVEFEDKKAVNKVFEEKEHVVNNKIITCDKLLHKNQTTLETEENLFESCKTISYEDKQDENVIPNQKSNTVFKDLKVQPILDQNFSDKMKYPFFSAMLDKNSILNKAHDPNSVKRRAWCLNLRAPPKYNSLDKINLWKRHRNFIKKKKFCHFSLINLKSSYTEFSDPNLRFNLNTRNI